MQEPLVSVVMSVYNAGIFLEPAIESILNQTFKDFEFIIINDGSTDKSHEIIKTYQDRRIVYINQKNKGMPISLNAGIKCAKGKYIARQDHDDISLPHRLEVQLNFLENHQDVGMLGTNLIVIDDKDEIVPRETANIDLLTSPDDLKLALVFSNQFGHGSLMIRRGLLMQSSGYNPRIPVGEDYDLWARISHLTKVKNLKEPLYMWRLHQKNISKNPKHAAKMLIDVLSIRDREFKYYLNHRGEYKLFSFHPFSMRGGLRAYMLRKSAIYRDMAIMYCRNGLRKQAILPIMLAIVHTPWLKRNYRQLFMILVSRERAAGADYELF